MNDSSKTFGILFLKRFWHLQKFCFGNWNSLNVLILVVLLIVEFAELYVGYHVGLISGKFYRVLGDKDWSSFGEVCIFSLALVTLICTIVTLRTYLSKLLAVGWRRQLTKKLHKMYCTHLNFYHLNVLDKSLDNSDQRITADVNLFCLCYAYVVAPFLLFPFNVGYYSYQAAKRVGWTGLLAILAFFILSSALNKLLMSPVVKYTAEQEKREGNFRFKHVCVRINSENLAFSGPTGTEHSKLNKKLNILCRVQNAVYNRQFFLNFATNFYAYISSIFSFMIIAVPIFNGKYDDLEDSEMSQMISENSFVCINLIYQFSKVVSLSAFLSDMAGATHRVSELIEICFLKFPRSQPEVSGKLDNISIPDGNPSSADVIYELKGVTYGPPNTSWNLVRCLDLVIRRGHDILIMGPSSSGKSSLLRILRGLWDIQSGEIRRNIRVNAKEMFFPQNVYLTDGSLRDQIVYPLLATNLEASEAQDQKIKEWLKELGLGTILLRCKNDLDFDPDWVWQDALSPGEIQRLAFVRLFYHRPDLAFLDEMTSALSADAEAKVMQMCSEMDITKVSIGHRESLKAYHHSVLTLGLENSSWTLAEIC